MSLLKRFPFLRPPIHIRSKLKLLWGYISNILRATILLIFILCVLFWLWSSFLSTISKDLAVGIIAGGTTIIISVLSILIAKYIEQQNVIRNEHMERKIPIYARLIKFLFDTMQEAGNGKLPDEAEVKKFMVSFTQEFLVWASDDVIRAFNEFRRPNHNPKSVLLAIDKILLMIRKDLGHENKGIVQAMLLNLFIPDIDNFLRNK